MKTKRNSFKTKWRTKSHSESTFFITSLVPFAERRIINMKKRMIFGVIGAEVSGSAQREIIKGIVKEAQLHNIDIAVISNTYNLNCWDYPLPYENQIYELILSEEFDGLIVLSEPFRCDKPRAKVREYLLQQKSIPIIVCGAFISDFDLPNATLIDTNDESDIEYIADHLIDYHGFTNIEFLTGPSDIQSSQIRLNGYKKSLEKHGIPFDGRKVIYGDFWMSSGRKLANEYISGQRPYPEAVMCANDYMAHGLLDEFAEKNIDISKYFAVTGYDYAWNRYEDVNNKYEEGRLVDRYTQNEYYGSMSALYTPTEYLSFSLAEDFFVNTLDNTLPECPFPKRYSSLTALAAQYKNTRLTMTASLLGTYVTERVERGERPDDLKRLSPAVSISWRIWAEQNLRLRFSYKDIFRIPTFNDMYYLRIGNTNLRPEKATQYNVGVTWSGDLFRIGKLELSVDGYYNRVKDKIVAMPTMFIWKMLNMGEVSIGGLDVNVSTELPLSKRWSLLLQGTYTYQHAIDITDETDKNYRDQIPYTPEHAGNVSCSLLNPWLNVTYNLTCVGDRYALPQNIEANRIHSYVDQSISVNREFVVRNCKLRLQGELLNLANKSYEVIQYYPMPGRSWRLSVSVIY